MRRDAATHRYIVYIHFNEVAPSGANATRTRIDHRLDLGTSTKSPPQGRMRRPCPRTVPMLCGYFNEVAPSGANATASRCRNACDRHYFNEVAPSGANATKTESARRYRITTSTKSPPQGRMRRTSNYFTRGPNGTSTKSPPQGRMRRRADKYATALQFLGLCANHRCLMIKAHSAPTKILQVVVSQHYVRARTGAASQRHSGFAHINPNPK